MSDDMESRMVRLEERAHTMDAMVLDLAERFIKHMDKEEESFKILSTRLQSIDKEIQGAFKERDAAINDLDKRIIKLLAYATSVFTVITFLVEVGVRFL